MANKTKRTFTIIIPVDPLNKDKEQYKMFQKDGVTKQVPIGKYVEVPEWVAVRAKEIGYIEDYLVTEK